MGFGGSANIFQAQIMDLTASLKFVQANMDDLLIIARRTLDKHLQRIETVLNRLREMLDSKSIRLSHRSVHMK